MRSTLMLSIFGASAFALPSPLSLTRRTGNWTIAPETSVTCDKTSDKIISFTVGPQLDTVLNDACAAMMPECAYPDRVSADKVCTQVMNYNLDGPKSSTQHVNVEQASTSNKLSGWDAKFSVTPAVSNGTSSSLTWTKADCYGYFEYMLMQQEPKGCSNYMGSGIGSLKVGCDSSLGDTVFNVTIVKRE